MKIYKILFLLYNEQNIINNNNDDTFMTINILLICILYNKIENIYFLISSFIKLVNNTSLLKQN